MTSKTKKIIKQIAMQNGVTPEFVEEEMRKAVPGRQFSMPSSKIKQ